MAWEQRDPRLLLEVQDALVVSEGTSAFTIEQGRVRSVLELDAGGFDVSLTGHTSLTGELSHDVMLSSEHLRLPLRLEGTLRRPRVELEGERSIREALGRLLERNDGGE